MPVAPESVLLFNALPTPHLLLSPAFVIEAVSDAYLRATLTQREHLVGQYMFDAFPDNPCTPRAQGMHHVRASLLQVLATGQPQTIARQHYDVPDPDRPGQFVERHWQAINAPLFDAQGQVVQIIHSAVDVTAEVRAQAQLHESQAAEQAASAEAEQQRNELERVFEYAPVAIAVYRGPAYTIEMANPTVARLWGRTRRQLLGKGLFEALPEMAGLGYEELLDGVMATGVPYVAHAMEAQHDRNGRRDTVYWDFVYVPLPAANGRTDRVMAVATEVTAQVLARRQIEQHNQELEARVQERTRQLAAAQAATERQRRQWYELFMRVPAGICIFNGPEWVYEFVNPGYQAMFPGRVLLGKRLVDALPEVANQPLMAILHHVYDTGEPFEASEVLVPLARTDGGPIEDIYFSLTYLARYNEAGQIDGFVTYTYDVTAQVLARREREAQEGQLQHLFEQAPVAICVFRGPAYVLALVNPPMGDMLGLAPAALVGRPFFEALPELATQGLREVLDNVRQTGVAFVAHERAIVLGQHAPEARFYSFAYEPLRDDQNQIVSITCVAIDVTPQVQARQRVQELNEELQASNEELNESNRQLTRTNVDLDTFVYTASHDLKAPIANIESIVLALRDTLPAAVQQDELVTHLLDLLNQTVARFQVTIGQLTDISRLQLAHVGPAEPVKLAQVVAAVRLDLASAIAAAGTQLTVAVAPELVVPFAPANLRSIVYNLLSNAVKYRAPGRPSVVQVRAAHVGPAVVLEVQDNGLGMSELQQPQLFGLFQRLHTHVEGTGVGLYITRRLLENAGGSIRVRSQPNVGSTFTATFPA